MNKKILKYKGETIIMDCRYNEERESCELCYIWNGIECNCLDTLKYAINNEHTKRYLDYRRPLMTHECVYGETTHDPIELILKHGIILGYSL